MPTTERLPALLEILRERSPVEGAALAREMGVTPRTLTKDIECLRAQGARIEGDAEAGYTLRPGVQLPALALTDDELETLMLGLRWVTGRSDQRLAQAGQSALDKVSAAIPPGFRHGLNKSTLFLRPQAPQETPEVTEAQIHEAIQAERKVSMLYRDASGRATTRVIWPVGLGYFDKKLVLVAWCEKREDFRHFRPARMVVFDILKEGFPIRRQALLERWQALEGIELVN